MAGVQDYYSNEKWSKGNNASFCRNETWKARIFFWVK